jgi:hypothetical protein
VPGDVVIFHPVDGVGSADLFGDNVFIKRVVAVEGDTVEVGPWGGRGSGGGGMLSVLVSAASAAAQPVPLMIRGLSQAVRNAHFLSWCFFPSTAPHHVQQPTLPGTQVGAAVCWRVGPLITPSTDAVMPCSNN